MRAGLQFAASAPIADVPIGDEADRGRGIRPGS
jgi:hypothetical protein